MNLKTLLKSLLPAALLGASLGLSGQALAFGEAYQQARFDGLLQAGKPVLVHIHAPWCSTCRTQDKRLGNLFQLPQYQAVTALEVSYDDQKDVVRGFRANSQSILIGFKDGREVGRLIGETRERGIAGLLDRLR